MPSELVVKVGIKPTTRAMATVMPMVQEMERFQSTRLHSRDRMVASAIIRVSM